MQLPVPSPERARWLVCALLMLGLGLAQAQTVILHLKNGDRIAGTIVSEDTNRVLITTTWIKELAVPVGEIARREIQAVAAAPAAAESKPATNAPAPPSAKDVLPSAQASTPVAIAAPPPKPQTPTPKRWKGEARIGADFLRNANDQQNFYGRFKLVYERPFASSPKQSVRNILDYGVDYGRTSVHGSTNEPIVSANRMDASDKTDFDVGRKKMFVYNLAGIGYDEIRKIDLRWEVGPGIGHHVVARSNLIANAEVGFNYQAQYRADDTTTEKFYYRLAEDLTWKLNKSLTFTEKFEFFPQVEDMTEYRFRFECTLSYGFWQNLSLNVSLLDLYDTQPASNVPNNDLQIRSSLGITF